MDPEIEQQMEDIQLIIILFGFTIIILIILVILI